MDKKIRNHSICEKKPLLAIVLAMIIPTLAVGLGSIIGGQISEEAGHIGMCIVAIIMMFVFKAWFTPYFKGFFKPENSAKNIFILMLPFILFIVYTLCEPLILKREFYFAPSFKAITMGLSAGFGEELMFRLFTLAIVMKYVKKEKRILSVILLAVFFGLAHMGNLKEGADLAMTVVQIFHSTFMGLLFSALYLKTGSAIFPIFAHGFYDYICFVTDPSVSSDGIITQQYSTPAMVLSIVSAVMVGTVTFCMFINNDFSTANKIWAKKWNVEKVEE